jgi:hypothetical protein
MGGGLMQLVAYGAQDIYLTGNPQITFFKVVYRRHTNFAMESIEQTFSGATDFGGTVSAVISRSGDLIGRTYVRIITPAVSPSNANMNFRWLNWLGHVLVKEVKLEIGGQEIDKQYGEWFHIWNELSQQPGQQANYAEMVGNVPKYVQPSTSAKPSREIYVPLQFFYCRNPGLALPLIALQYHEVKITVSFRTAAECYWSENTTEPNVTSISASLWIDYIFLDTDERRRFAQKSHEYLIEQLQSTTESIQASANRINLPFNHPVKELVWVIQKDAHVNSTLMQPVGGMQWFNFTDRVDTTNFTGTPSHPSGGGLGGSAHIGLYPLAGLPMGGGSYAPNSGVLAGAPTIRAPSAFDYNTSSAVNINLSSLSFFDLFGNGNAASADAALGYSSNLPVFDVGENPTQDAKLMLNGTDRFVTRTGFYFNHVQPYQHHTNGPAPGICVYSFALTPEEHQPSGTCNFSRIDTATLQINTTANTLKAEDGTTATTAKIRIYATNYNVLRIMSGMGGLAYSN